MKIVNFLMNLAGAFGFGFAAFLQRKNKPSSKKWLLAIIISIAFLCLAVCSLLGRVGKIKKSYSEADFRGRQIA